MGQIVRDANLISLPGLSVYAYRYLAPGGGKKKKKKISFSTTASIHGSMSNLVVSHFCRIEPGFLGLINFIHSKVHYKHYLVW